VTGAGRFRAVELAGVPGRWADQARWSARIDEAVDDRDPVLSNLRITLLHRELSIALRWLIGDDSGANFHTWAVWGSKTAGRTIRREDLPVPMRAVTPTGVLGGAGAAALMRRSRSRGREGGRAGTGRGGTGRGGTRSAGTGRGGSGRGGPGRAAAVAVAGGASLGAAAGREVGRLADRAARSIFAGNATVLDDIGRQSARFLSASGSDVAFEAFEAQLRPGPPEAGGQDLLRGAYRHYREAARAADPDHRDELMLYANLLAILHEHHRLEPYIDDSLPKPVRRLVTARLLGFSIGHESMRVSGNVAPDHGAAFPATLATIEDRDLAMLLDGPGGLDRTPDSLDGSAAHDWTNLSDRMNFICDLFRSRQLDPELFEPPYTDAQAAAIAAGQVPDGPL
jgi:hypothetical protein